MAINTVIRINHAGVQADTTRKLIAANQMHAGLKLTDFIKSIVSGMIQAKVEIGVEAVKASGTITLSSHVNTNTVTVNGIQFSCVASGATGNQYNVGGTDAETATNLAAALNANATLDGMIIASANGAVVTVEALYPGEIGNALTLAISANGSVSGARLTGGTNGSQTSTVYYGSQTEA